MNKKFIKYIFSIILLSVAQLLCAQTKTDPWTLGFWGIKTEYIGDLGNNVFKFGNNFYAGGALSFDRYINRFFDVGIYGSVSSIGIDKGISTYSDFDKWISKSEEYNNTVKNFKVKTLTNINIHTRFKIWGKDKARAVPYIGVLAGMAFYRNITTNYTDANGQQQHYPSPAYDASKNLNALTLGCLVGFEWRISSAFSVRYQLNGNWTNHDDIDFYAEKGNDWQLHHNIGFTYSFNGKRKNDNGVPENQNCPPALPKEETVKNDTPTDTDGDGVPDDLDQCQSEFGLPEKNGCNFSPILFETGKFLPNSIESTIKLDSIADILVRQPKYTVIISGHTDSQGTASYDNKNLSIKRADAVKQYLVDKGIDKNRIITEGYGFDRPVADNSTSEGRAQNRRVEIIFGATVICVE